MTNGSVLVMFDAEGVELSVRAAPALSPSAMGAIAIEDQCLRWRDWMDMMDVTPEQVAAVRKLNAEIEEAQKEVTERPEPSPGFADYRADDLMHRFNLFSARMSVRSAAEELKAVGLAVFGCRYTHWDMITLTTNRVPSGYDWYSMRVAAMVIAPKMSPEMQVQIDLGEVPPPVAPPGDLPHFADGREIPVAGEGQLADH